MVPDRPGCSRGFLTFLRAFCGIGWTILNLMLGFVGPSLGVTLAVWAHVGGFVAGLLLTWPLLHWKYRQA